MIRGEVGVEGARNAAELVHLHAGVLIVAGPGDARLSR